ncbi:MAG: hypothetical protein A2W85_02855 [Bacteroidetes bacterium GWF2_41_31]|nr:MAG: hypothetical protein A2W85_02855 [Bacteroidetes bacterium GWF2_41_31]
MRNERNIIKVIIAVVLGFIMQSQNSVMSQSLLLYKADTDVTSDLYNVYLLLYPSGNYYLISEYNYGEPISDFYLSNSDVLPMEIWLSWGIYKENNDTLILTDSNLNFTQRFLFNEDGLFGLNCFSILKGNVLYEVQQQKELNAQSDTLHYRGGFFTLSSLIRTYNKYNDTIRELIKTNLEKARLETHIPFISRNVNYSDFYTPLKLNLDSCNRFKYKLGSICLLKGTYRLVYNKILLKADELEPEFVMRITDKPQIICIKIPGALPGTIFKESNAFH